MNKYKAPANVNNTIVINIRGERYVDKSKRPL